MECCTNKKSILLSYNLELTITSSISYSITETETTPIFNNVLNKYIHSTTSLSPSSSETENSHVVVTSEPEVTDLLKTSFSSFSLFN